MRLSTSTNILSYDWKSPCRVPFEESVAAARAAGYRYLDANLSILCQKGYPAASLTEDGWESLVPGWRALADRIGVKFTQAHAYFSISGPVPQGAVPGGDFGEEMIRRCVLAAEILGVEWMVIHPFNVLVNGQISAEASYRSNLEYFRRWHRFWHGHHVGMAIENMSHHDTHVNVWGDIDRLIALVAAMLLDQAPGATIVTDSVTSSGLSAFIAEWGGIHYRFKRGYRSVIDEAIRLNAEGIDCPLAIETSGHAAFRDNGFVDDGIYLATRVICEALNRKREGQSVFSLIDDLKEPVESVEIRLPVLEAEDPSAASQEVVETLLSYTLDDPSWQIAQDNREGVRIIFNLDGDVNNAWFQLRMSVHDPVMVLNAESDVPGGVKRILGALYALIQDNQSLDLEKLRRAAGKD